MSSEVTVVEVSPPQVLGEGPHWDDRDRCLYYVDIDEQTLHKYSPDSQKLSTTKLDDRVGFIVPVEDSTNQFVVGVGRKFLVVEWDGTDGKPAKVVKELGEVDRESPKNRINDGKADPRGRIFAGTMGIESAPLVFEQGKGSLYCIDGDKVTKVADQLGISNGLAWDLKERAFYFIDSLERNIRRYDYDVDTGKITNKTYIFDFVSKNIDGFPDGMTIDTDGNLWVAVYGGSVVLHIDPKSGNLIKKIPLAAKQITSVTFGGPNLDTLFVTSAGKNLSGSKEGHTFKITGLGAKGLPNSNYAPA